MGTDIHIIAEYKGWSDKQHIFPIPPVFTQRFYSFFGELAGVRNIPNNTEDILSLNRGFPEDAGMESCRWREEALFSNDDWDRLPDFAQDMTPGDHSWGYATLHEIKSHKWSEGVRGNVVDDLIVFLELLKKSSDTATDNDIRIIFNFDS